MTGLNVTRKKKKRRFYAGKPIKKRNLKSKKYVPYKSKRKKTDPIKIWFWEVGKMSYDGYKRWCRDLRPYVKKVVFRPVGCPILIDPEYISNKEKLGQVAIDLIGYDGVFQLRMPTTKKNRFHVSFCKKASITITSHEEGLKAKVTDFHKLTRYWFWDKK